MSFVPECSSLLHSHGKIDGRLSLMHVFFFYTTNKDGASFEGHVIVPINGHICKFN